jgi:hypothetical protein
LHGRRKQRRDRAQGCWENLGAVHRPGAGQRRHRGGVAIGRCVGPERRLRRPIRPRRRDERPCQLGGYRGRRGKPANPRPGAGLRACGRCRGRDGQRPAQGANASQYLPGVAGSGGQDGSGSGVGGQQGGNECLGGVHEGIATTCGVGCPHGAEGRRWKLFNGEAVDGFSRGLEGLLVAAEVLHLTSGLGVAMAVVMGCFSRLADYYIIS